jgi:hypothetical protein
VRRRDQQRDDTRRDLALAAMNALRRVAVFAIPAVLYFAVRPFTNSDAVALAIAGALPLAYGMILVLVGRRVDGSTGGRPCPASASCWHVSSRRSLAGAHFR